MNSNKVFTNFIWRFLERCGAQLVTFVVSLVLARILNPTIYGTVAIVTSFTTIVSVFVDSGFANALIQKKDADQIDFSTVFYFNVIICLLLYGLIFILAPLFALFYEMTELTSLIRVAGLIIVISGIKNVQVAYVSKNFLFKKFFFATLGGTIVAAVVGILMAVYGFGAWALVTQLLVNHTIDTIILWLIVKWRPSFTFSIKRLKCLFSYGWKLLIAGLVETVYNEIRGLLIGKVYSSEDLAYYNKGQIFPKLLVTNINNSIDTVLLPAMSAEQDRIERVKSMTRRSIKTGSFILFPMMAGLFACSNSIIMLLLGEQWLPCVFFLRVFCVTYAFYPILSTNGEAIKAIGRSDVFLRNEVIKKIVGFSILIGTLFISVKAIAWGLIISCAVNQIITAWPNKKLIGYSYIEQIKDILPVCALSVFMCSVVMLLGLIQINYIILLIIQVVVGVALYVGGAYLFKIESLSYVKDLVRSLFRRAH